MHAPPECLEVQQEQQQEHFEEDTIAAQVKERQIQQADHRTNQAWQQFPEEEVVEELSSFLLPSEQAEEPQMVETPIRGACQRICEELAAPTPPMVLPGWQYSP